MDGNPGTRLSSPAHPGNAVVPARSPSPGPRASPPARCLIILHFFCYHASMAENSNNSGPDHRGWHSRGYLPHFDAEDAFQSVTFRLVDSVPAHTIERWKTDLKWTEETKQNSKEAVTLRNLVEKYEDRGFGACYLRDRRIASLVRGALQRFDNERYKLIAWCIMPNHVHVMMKTISGCSLSSVIQNWKSFTAHMANKLLGRKGRFWMPGYFDRYIRNQNHYLDAFMYVIFNPVKAGLVESPEKWPWSGGVLMEEYTSRLCL